jgi:hypothetical protein
VSSKKQRRRREKVQRHEWEYVEIDGEGNEAPVEPPQSKNAVAATKTKAKPHQRDARSPRRLREVKPPSWSRSLKRGALFVPFLYLFLTVLEHTAPLTAVGVSLLYAAVFVPMFFFVDRMAYRTYQRRLGERSS